MSKLSSGHNQTSGLYWQVVFRGFWSRNLGTCRSTLWFVQTYSIDLPFCLADLLFSHFSNWTPSKGQMGQGRCRTVTLLCPGSWMLLTLVLLWWYLESRQKMLLFIICSLERLKRNKCTSKSQEIKGRCSKPCFTTSQRTNVVYMHGTVRTSGPHVQLGRSLRYLFYHVYISIYCLFRIFVPSLCLSFCRISNILLGF